MSSTVKPKNAVLPLVVLHLLAFQPASAQTDEQKREWAQKTKDTITAAAVAEESWRTSHDSYTDEVSDLQTQGFNKPPSMRVRIPKATEFDYCIQAKHRRLDRWFHYEATEGRVKKGRC